MQVTYSNHFRLINSQNLCGGKKNPTPDNTAIICNIQFLVWIFFFSFHQFVRHQLKFPERKTNVRCFQLWKSYYTRVTIFQSYLASKRFFVTLERNQTQNCVFVFLTMKTINSKKSSRYKNLRTTFSPSLNLLVLTTQ